MRDGVVGIRNSDFVISARAAFAAEHEGADARSAGLKGDGHQIEHQLSIAVEGRWDAAGFFDRRSRLLDIILGKLDTALDFADGAEVFFEASAVGGAELGGQTPGIVQNIIENAGFVAAALEAVLGFSSAAPNSRSKTARGFTSGGTGEVGVRQESVLL